MDIPSPILAILISVLSLALSLHTGVTARRASQLQRLSAIRTKATALVLHIRLDISQYERHASQLDRLPSDESKTWVEDVRFMTDLASKLESMEGDLDQLSAKIARFPLSLKAGEIDELEYQINTIAESVKISSERILPRMAKLAEQIAAQSSKHVQVTHESRSALARSQLFLRMASECAADERIEFEAFIEATIVFARAALHRFQAKHSSHPQWQGWWSDLRENPAFEFFRTERDWLLKEASPKIGQRGFAASVGQSRPSYEPTKAAEFYFFEASVSATDTIARHLQEVERVLKIAEVSFAP